MIVVGSAMLAGKHGAALLTRVQQLGERLRKNAGTVARRSGIMGRTEFTRGLIYN